MTTSTESIEKLRVKSVYIPEKRKKEKEQKRLSFLNWMADTIKSTHYTNDRQLSDALLSIDK